MNWPCRLLEDQKKLVLSHVVVLFGAVNWMNTDDDGDGEEDVDVVEVVEVEAGGGLLVPVGFSPIPPFLDQTGCTAKRKTKVWRAV